MDYVSAFNAIEVVLWSGLAVFVLWRFRRRTGSIRRWSWMTAAFLLLFAVSDAIEIHTGAWWRPPSLLAFKTVCVLGIVAGGTAMVRASRAKA